MLPNKFNFKKMKWINYLFHRSFRVKQIKCCNLSGKLDDYDVKVINIR